jgi:hypothetical protein
MESVTQAVPAPTAEVVFSCEEDSVQRSSFIVSEALAEKLNDQLDRLATVDASRPGKERYQLARQAGCFAAIAKGAKDRKLEPDQVYIPKTELMVKDGKVRISALKATLNLPGVFGVVGIVFLRDHNIDHWHGYVEADVISQAT